jgi:hypothetical protein
LSCLPPRSLAMLASCARNRGRNNTRRRRVSSVENKSTLPGLGGVLEKGFPFMESFPPRERRPRTTCSFYLSKGMRPHLEQIAAAGGSCYRPEPARGAAVGFLGRLQPVASGSACVRRDDVHGGRNPMQSTCSGIISVSRPRAPRPNTPPTPAPSRTNRRSPGKPWAGPGAG